MLSSQTKDQVTSAAMAKLRNHGCTVDNILQTDNKVLEQLIYPVGFYKVIIISIFYEYIENMHAAELQMFGSDLKF